MTFPALPALALLFLFGFSFLVWLWVSATLLLWGARFAGVERRSFGSAIGTVLLGGIASIVLTVFVGTATLSGPGLGLLLGFIVSAVITMATFDTSFGKALAANILAWLLGIAVAIVFAWLAAVVIVATLAYFSW